jgi:hypothetical protein
MLDRQQSISLAESSQRPWAIGPHVTTITSLGDRARIADFFAKMFYARQMREDWKDPANSAGTLRHPMNWEVRYS